MNALLQLGFRPFFLFGCLFGSLAASIWSISFAGWQVAPAVDVLWHAHEMIYGFVMAIVGGFLLTASQNWTGTRSVHGKPLILLCLIWLAGRVAFLIPATNPILAYCIDLLFLPFVMFVLGRILAPGKNKRNYVFLVLLALLWISNVGFHGAKSGWILMGNPIAWLEMAVHVIVLMIAVISGRVLPFFTSRVLSDYKRPRTKYWDVAVPLSIAGFAVVFWWDSRSALIPWLAGLALIANLGRFILWFDRRILKIPMLAILMIGNLWIVLGFGAHVLAWHGKVTVSTATHFLTAGAMGTMIAGMVVRVGLGHTGRTIHASRPILLAFGLVLGGAFLRVVGPVFFLEHYTSFVAWGGGLFALSFAIIGIYLAPILVAPRPDGEPG